MQQSVTSVPVVYGPRLCPCPCRCDRFVDPSSRGHVLPWSLTAEFDQEDVRVHRLPSAFLKGFCRTCPTVVSVTLDLTLDIAD